MRHLMRILLVAQWFPPIIGGEERHVLHLGQELQARGHEVAVVTLLQSGLPEDEMISGLPVRRIRGTAQRVDRMFRDGDRKSAPPMPDPELIAGLRRVIGELRPNVIHAHNWLLYSLLPLQAFLDTPLVVTLHDFSLVCVRKDLMFMGAADCAGPNLAKCLRCASRYYGPAKAIATVGGIRAMAPLERLNVDRFIAVSRSIADGNRLAAVGVPYAIIPNFILDPDPTPTGSAGNRAIEVSGLPDTPFLLYVGAISRVKGVPELLRAYADLSEAPPLVLIGYPGADTAEILAGLPPRVIYLENLPHELVQEAWRRSRLGIVPSTWRDASPTVVLESMAAGTPLVASRVGGIPDLVEDGRSGILVEPGDVAGLRDALDRVLRDGALAARLARAGLQRVQAFTATAVVPRIVQVYEEVIGGLGR